ncbi:MAG: hypothetical protein JHD33_09115, partial [Chthoniobacterales bacterium]|nr:hypothetical protein [Chthoniobacterales bacterium]
MGEPRFRRTVVIVALLHGLAVCLLFYWSTREVRVQQARVTWLNTADFLPPEPEEEEPVDPKKFDPLPETEPVPASELSSNPSEIALPTPTPTPIPTATPTPTPKPT